MPIKQWSVFQSEMNFWAVSGNLQYDPSMRVKPEQLFEQTLVVRSQLGDEEAFNELLRLHGPRLLRFAQRMMASSPDQIADVMQETWVSIYRALPRLADAGKFKAWAFRIARDSIYRQYRRRKVETQPIGEVDLDGMCSSTDNVTSADLEELQNHLAVISPEHREVLVLRFQEDMSYEEIARVTGASIGTVRSRIHYAKGALRAAMKGMEP